MAAITVGSNSINSIYNESPIVGYFPFYSNFPSNGLKNSQLYYDEYTQIMSFGASFLVDDGNAFTVIGYEAPGTTGYVKADVANQTVTIGANTIKIQNVTLAATAGGTAWHLPVTVNGSNYKIQLLNI